MKKLSLGLLALAMVLAIAPAALADSFTYAIAGSNFSADLTFTANQIAGQPSGVEVITGVTGWFEDPDTSGRVNITLSNPATVIDAGGAIAPNYASHGIFQYDNVLYTNQTGNGILDWDGVLFSVGSYELNIFSDSNESDAGYFYFADNGNYQVNTQITNGYGGPAPDGLTAAPEPGSLFLFGAGFLGLAFVLYRRAAKRSQPVVNS
jgi:hypothetical protein